MSDCICEDCHTMERMRLAHESGEEREWDCACDMWPVYDAERCGECRHRGYCDVPERPCDYPADRDA